MENEPLLLPLALCPPGFGGSAQTCKGRLDGCLFVRYILARRVARYVDWLANERGRARERQWYLQAVPAWNLDVAPRRDVKWEYRLPGVPRKGHRAGLCDISRAAWAIYRERDLHSVIQTMRHLSQPSPSAPSRRTARGAV